MKAVRIAKMVWLGFKIIQISDEPKKKQRPFMQIASAVT